MNESRTRIKLDLTPAFVQAIRQTPEYALKPNVAKAVRLIVERAVIFAPKIQGESKTQNP